MFKCGQEVEKKYCISTIYMAMPHHNNLCPRGQGIYNFGRPFLGHHYYIISFSDLYLGVEKISKQNYAFLLYDLYGYALAQKPLSWGSWNLQFW